MFWPVLPLFTLLRQFGHFGLFGAERLSENESHWVSPYSSDSQVDLIGAHSTSLPQLEQWPMIALILSLYQMRQVVVGERFLCFFWNEEHLHQEHLYQEAKEMVKTCRRFMPHHLLCRLPSL